MIRFGLSARLSLMLCAGLAGCNTMSTFTPAPKEAPDKAAILATMERMADAQLATPRYAGPNPPADWVGGTFYAGLARLSHVATSPRFHDAALRVCNRYDWKFQLASNHPSQGHADDECIGQMYIDMAVTTGEVPKLSGMRAQLDEIIAGYNNPTDAARRAWDNNLQRDGTSWPWWWCDSLFMAPAVFTRMSAVTGDGKYIDAADKQWWFTYERLYDPQEHLFFRDSKYPARRTDNGKKVFWSRGNGWVIAGTANVLMYMPRNYPTRSKYERMFKDMAGKLAEIQQPDGLWRGSLLDPVASPWPETSGTAFFTYALAWGINNDYLDSDKFRPVVEKAWVALNNRIRPDGLLGFVQQIGEQPAAATIDNTQAYASGAFLLAGCEIIKLHAQ